MKSEKKRSWAASALGVVLVCSILLLGLYVVVPRLGGRANAKKMAAGTDVSIIRVALENFSRDCGRFPTAAEGLQALMVRPSGAADWKGPYLEKGVRCDPWGNAYVYQCPGEHNKKTFDLCSFGPDGHEGGGDDLDNWNHP